MTKQLDIHKICAVTLTGKRPPNRDPELQRTELVQDTKALMVQDTKALMVQDTKMVSASQLSAGQSGVYKCKHKTDQWFAKSFGWDYKPRLSVTYTHAKRSHLHTLKIL